MNHIVFVRRSDRATDCLRQFLGRRYTPVVVDVFAKRLVLFQLGLNGLIETSPEECRLPAHDERVIVDRKV